MTGLEDRQALGRPVTEVLPLLIPFMEMMDGAIKEGQARQVEKALCRFKDVSFHDRYHGLSD